MLKNILKLEILKTFTNLIKFVFEKLNSKYKNKKSLKKHKTKKTKKNLEIKK